VIAALSSEWLKIRTTRTLFWLLVALSALITLIVIAAVIGSKAKNISSAKDQLDLLGIGSLALLIALIMGLIVSTGEFRHGTITPTLLATPSRTSVVIAKALAGMFFAVALVGLAEGLVALELAIALPAKGVDFAIQGGPAAAFLGRTLIAAALWGALGSGIGIVIRNQIGAVVASFAWLFIAEGLIIAILHSHAINSNAGRFLPFQATGAILNTDTSNSADMLSHAGGIATLSGWMALITIAALVLLNRRDVS
jgi:ABC-type transport system involved in multi-copper enzyme maturation permease subunit